MRRLMPMMVALICMSSILAGAARPAGADDITRKRNQLRQKQAQVKIQINLAMASDGRIEAEAKRLSRSVVAEQGLVAGARSALSAAQSRVADEQHRLDAINASAAIVRQALLARAIDTYEHPFHSQELALSGVSGISQYAERQALVTAVQGRTSDILDAYRQQRLDALQAGHDLFAARTLAERRQVDVQAEEDVLASAKLHADQTHAVLTARIANLKSESQTLAAQEAKLEAQLAANTATYGPAINQLAPGSHSALRWPLHGPVTREFGYQSGGFHPGIDIAAAWGTPIHASGSGVVIYAGWESGYGNYTCINHGGGVSTCYGHQSAIYVSVGQTVSDGQVVGAEGSTGMSTGPHVHFEVRVNTIPNNPRRFIGGSP